MKAKMLPTPIYTPCKITCSYKLYWSVSIFWKNQSIENSKWITDLKELVEKDGVRILEQRKFEPNIEQFLVSTPPKISPEKVIWSIKGRLQNLIKNEIPKAFKRNYSIRSVGEVEKEIIEKYVGGQLDRHRMADPKMQEIFNQYQINNSNDRFNDLRKSGHGMFSNDLHFVFVRNSRFNQAEEKILSREKVVLMKAATKKGHLMSRAGVVSDHIHLAIGCGINDSPEDVACSYLNNLAFVNGMRPVFQNSFYVGTFGEYDLGAIRKEYRSVQNG